MLVKKDEFQGPFGFVGILPTVLVCICIPHDIRRDAAS